MTNEGLQWLVKHGPHWAPHPDIKDLVPVDPEWGAALVAVADIRAALVAHPDRLDVERLAQAYAQVMVLAPDSWPTSTRWEVIADMYARLSDEGEGGAGA